MKRRDLLALSTAGVSLLAGCSGTDDDTTDDNGSGEGNGDGSDGTDSADDTDGDDQDGTDGDDQDGTDGDDDQDGTDGDDDQNDTDGDGQDGTDGDDQDVDIEGEFDETVLDVLLSADQVPGDWETTGTPDGGVSSPRAVASQARDLESAERESITLGMTLFDSPVGAEEFLGVRANRLADQGATVTQEDLGDQAQSITSEGQTAFDLRLSNLTILVIGDIDVSRLKTIAQAQLAAVSR